eukprot:COSAG06_NODE_6562_length_2880_cov_6.605178_2_plen_38_part_00
MVLDLCMWLVNRAAVSFTFAAARSAAFDQSVTAATAT